MDDDEMPPYMRTLQVAIDRTLTKLVADGQVELEEPKRPPLLDELLQAAAKAETPHRMLKALVRTLVGSDHVEEVYATDDELRDVFKAHIEGT